MSLQCVVRGARAVGLCAGFMLACGGDAVGRGSASERLARDLERGDAAPEPVVPPEPDAATAPTPLDAGAPPPDAPPPSPPPRDGTILTLAGDGTPGDGGDDGPAVDASLNQPRGMVVAPDGSLYFADCSNHRIRRVSLDGRITSVAGNGSPGFDGDGGPAIAASLNAPEDVAIAADGSLIVADVGNLRVRRVAPDGTITTLAGNGSFEGIGDGGPALLEGLDVKEVGVGPDGSVFILENVSVRRVAPDGIVTSVAGGDFYGNFNGPTPALRAGLGTASALAVTPDGTLYVSDIGYRGALLQFPPDGSVNELAGLLPPFTGGADGDPAIGAPVGNVCAIHEGAIYLTGGPAVRIIDPDGLLDTVAGQLFEPAEALGDGGPARGARLGSSDCAIGLDGSLFIADILNDRIRRVQWDSPEAP